MPFIRNIMKIALPSYLNILFYDQYYSLLVLNAYYLVYVSWFSFPTFSKFVYILLPYYEIKKKIHYATNILFQYDKPDKRQGTGAQTYPLSPIPNPVQHRNP